MLEHLVNAREQGGAGPDGQSASARRNEDDAKRNNGLEVWTCCCRGFSRENVHWVLVRTCIGLFKLGVQNTNPVHSCPVFEHVDVDHTASSHLNVAVVSGYDHDSTSQCRISHDPDAVAQGPSFVSPEAGVQHISPLPFLAPLSPAPKPIPPVRRYARWVAYILKCSALLHGKHLWLFPRRSKGDWVVLCSILPRARANTDNSYPVISNPPCPCR